MTDDDRDRWLRAFSEVFETQIGGLDTEPAIRMSCEGQELVVRIDEAEGAALVSAPVANAHDGLGDAALSALLAANADPARTGGAVLRVADRGVRLELLNALPLGGGDPRRVAQLAKSQAIAAIELGELARRAGLEEAGPAVEGDE